MTTDSYHVTISIRGEQEPVQVTLALTEAFSQSECTLPVPTYLAGDPQSRAIEVDFAQLDGKASPSGAGASPAGGALERLAELQLEPSAMLPAI